LATPTTASAPALILALWLLRGAALAVGLLAPFWYWNGGLMEIEALQFIRQYLGERTLLQKIFDPRANDFGNYQARELSYFVDYLDARAFEALIGQDLTVFVPLSALMAGLLTAGVLFSAIRRYPGLPPFTVALLLLVYFSNYVYLVTAGMYYRSTKPLLAPVLMATVFYVLALLDAQSRPERRPTGRRAIGAVFLLFSLMGLLDRQGFFYAAVGLALLVVNAIAFKGRRDVVLAAGGAVAFLTLYNIALVPLLVQWVSGYAPSFEYQQLPIAQLVGNPMRWVQGTRMLLEANAVLMGGVPYWVGGALLGVLLMAAAWQGAWKTAAVSGAVLVAQVIMFTAMIVRHPPVYEWSDHRLWYYPLPFQVLALCGMVVILSRLVATWRRGRIVALNLVLAGCVCSNIMLWDGYRREMRGAPWFPTVEYQTFLLKASLRNGRPLPGLTPEYRGFYELCVSLSPSFQRGPGAADDRVPGLR
jgi:hypothetical protein